MAEDGPVVAVDDGGQVGPAFVSYGDVRQVHRPSLIATLRRRGFAPKDAGYQRSPALRRPSLDFAHRIVAHHFHLFHVIPSRLKGGYNLEGSRVCECNIPQCDILASFGARITSSMPCTLRGPAGRAIAYLFALARRRSSWCERKW